MVNNFRGRQPEHEHSHMDNLAQMPMISIPRVESPLEKVMSDFFKKQIKCSFPGRMVPAKVVRFRVRGHGSEGERREELIQRHSLGDSMSPPRTISTYQSSLLL